MKYLFLFFIISIGILNSGCQKNCAKKGPAMRCIYDQSVFADVCARVLSDESYFQSFKSDPFYSLLYQGFSYEDGWACLQTIEKDYPSLIAQFEQFRTSDCIGGPKIYDYGNYGMFSAMTLHDIQIAGMIQKKIGHCSRVIQIGAGYGGLCKILHDLSLFETYAIVDLPEHLSLARAVLERQGISNVQFISLDELEKNGQYDLVVSDWSFSEFSRPLQKMFADRILLRARAGLILGHTFPKHFGVDAFSPTEIKAYLKKKKDIPFEMYQTSGERADYYLIWNKKNRIRDVTSNFVDFWFF